MKPHNLADRLIELMNTSPGQKASDLARKLGVDKNAVNSTLYGPLRSRVTQDRQYRWWLQDGKAPDAASRQTTDTLLAKLCRYYLDCLSLDDLGGVSVFAASHHDLDYAELSSVPNVGSGDVVPVSPGACDRLLNRARRDMNRHSVYLGYPIRLKFARSKKGWEGFFVEPLLLFSFHGSDGRFSNLVLGEDTPQINFKALQSLSNVGENGLMEEAVQLADELGLTSAPGEQPGLDELLLRLRAIRDDWDWQEDPNPQSLSTGAPLPFVDVQGIYNRAVLVVAERSPFTKGLETELGSLQAISGAKYKATAVGGWLQGEATRLKSADEMPLVEVLPLNSEQRQAVRQALNNPLTVITGPPGTGKSQVVTSILTNAAWQGKTVLFASKNNKAVDVVETRANALGPRPVLLRLGRNEYQSRLSEYLVSLLAARSTTEDRQQFDERLRERQRLEASSTSLDRELVDLIALRNKVDAIEQQVEASRLALGEKLFQKARRLNTQQIGEETKPSLECLTRATRANQSWLMRVLWPLIRNQRYADLAKVAVAGAEATQQLQVAPPLTAPSDQTIDEWIRWGDELQKRLSLLTGIREYYPSLEALTSGRQLEDISQERVHLNNALSENAEALWANWLRLQPARMSAEQRRLLGEYSSVIQMMAAADERNQFAGSEVFRRYYQLFPAITSILSCWAVTSLSARGRLPLEPGFFDLLVIDEASQCDIASALPLLYRAKRAVVIGDPKQLRHISKLSKAQDRQLLAKHGLLDEMKWAYSTRSLFDLASNICGAEDIVVLRDHHRSHADIIDFANERFYEGRLRVATKYEGLRRPSPNEPAVRWIHVSGKVVRPAPGGAINEHEARAVVDEIRRLVSQEYVGSIGVVSPFRAQANHIRDLVHMDDALTRSLVNTDFLVDTVHKFQGDERDVMFFSPVLAAGMPGGALGFLKSSPNLFNVAITRARAALIVVGDRTAALSSEVDYLSSFAKYVEQLEKSGVRPPSDTAFDLGPDYPVVTHPDRVSDWERLLYKSLYRAGLRSIPQYPVEKYVLDLALIHEKRRLNIEVDGERYHRNWDGELCRRDQIRNQRLMELGWDVMRFWVYQIRDDMPKCVERVQQWFQWTPEQRAGTAKSLL